METALLPTRQVIGFQAGLRVCRLALGSAAQKLDRRWICESRAMRGATPGNL